MPYYLHAKPAEPERGTPFDTAIAAHAANDSPSTHKVSFIPSEEEKQTWRERESDRFLSGRYTRVPWCGALDRHPDHYAHLSLSHAGLVAYTKNEEHGVSDRQTRIRPGKYLEEFYPDVAFSTREQWIRACTAHDTKQLHFAVTPDEIERVYMGPIPSCMGRYSHGGSENSWGCPDNPVRVYGNSDLQLAYIGEIDNAIARCLVWPEKQRFSRTYGPQENTLRALLENAGYTQGSLSGAKIRKVRCNGGFIAPYVDGIEYAREDGSKWLVLGDGAIPMQHTNGVAAEEEEEEDTRYTCDNCNDSFSADDSESTEYCQSCYDDSYVCIDCDGTYFSDGTSTDNGMLCEHCYSNRLKTCAVCEREWLEEEEFSRGERADRRSDGTSELCRRCAGSHTNCNHCGEWFVSDDNDRCEECRPEEEEDDSEDTESDDTPVVPPAVPTVRYMRNARIEFHGEIAYLMLDTVGTLWAIDRNGIRRLITNNWNRDWSGFIASGTWEYFTPFPAQDLLRPVLAHAVPPYATPATTPATIGGEL